MPNITETSMMVRLSISQWTAQKYDRKVSGQATAAHGAEASAGKFFKDLIKCSSLDGFRKTADEARNYNYQRTLPWLDQGVRILPAKLYLPWAETMHSFKEDCEAFLKDFIRDYTTAREEARGRLGTMFNEDDYPSEDNVEQKFSFDASVFPISDATDWRVKGLKANEAEIKRNIEKRNKEAQAEMTKWLWEQIYEKVKHMHERLDDPDRIFRNSMIDKCIELTDLLPQLNVMDDPKLNKMAREVRKALCSDNPDTLRTDTNRREQVAKEAEDILKKMENYI